MSDPEKTPEKKKKRGRGRPTKRSPELEKRICAEIEGGLGKDKAAILSGIAASTLHEWENRYADFAEAIKSATIRFETNQLLVIREAAVNRYNRNGDLTRRGSWVAAAWLLERKLHETYGQKWQGELSGRGGKPLIPEKPSVDLSKYTDQQIEALIALGSLKPPKPESGSNGHNGATH